MSGYVVSTVRARWRVGSAVIVCLGCHDLLSPKIFEKDFPDSTSQELGGEGTVDCE